MKDLTFGQIEMGITFNPSGDPEVIRVKQLYADIADALNDLRNTSTSQNQKRWCSVGITEAAMAQMAAVRAITWKDPVFDFKARVVDRSLDIPVLVDFYSDTCGPCIMIAPKLEALAEEMNFELVKINAPNNRELTESMGIRGVPALYIYHKGESVWNANGAGENTIQNITDVINDIRK